MKKFVSPPLAITRLFTFSTTAFAQKHSFRTYDKDSNYRSIGNIPNIPYFTVIFRAGATVSAMILRICRTPCELTPPACAVRLAEITAVGGGSIIAAVTQ